MLTRKTEEKTEQCIFPAGDSFCKSGNLSNSNCACHKSIKEFHSEYFILHLKNGLLRKIGKISTVK